MHTPRCTAFGTREHPKNVYKGGIDVEAFSDWAVHYFKTLDELPGWYEPMNEPFVHVTDFYDEPDGTLWQHFR